MPDHLRVAVDAIIFSLQGPGGISRIFAECLPRMCRLDPELEFEMLLRPPLQQSLAAHSRIHPHRLVPIPRPTRILRPLLQTVNLPILRAAIKECAVWHSTYYTLSPISKIRSIVTVYDMIYELFNSTMYFRDASKIIRQKRKAIEKADCLICISQAAKEQMGEFYPRALGKTRVVHLSPSPSFAPMPESDMELGAIGDTSFILYVGRRSHYKDFVTLAKAYSRWASRTDIMMRVVGPPWSEEEVTMLHNLEIFDKVILESGVSDRQLRMLYCSAAAFIYPSLCEGFGIPVLEAMACGCRVIASRIPSTLEIAGEIPEYFEPGNTDSLLQALEDLCEGKTNSDRLRRGIECARSYSWDKTAAEILTIYRELS